MKIVLGTRRVVDKVLSAVVAEVSALLNPRPLTHLSVDHRDHDPLTPNHFLHAKVLGYFPLKRVHIADLQLSANRFVESQAIVNHFW